MPVHGNVNHQPADAPIRPSANGVPRSATETAPATPATPARTRVSAAWLGACVGALVLVVLVVFMLQNTTPVEVAFLGMAGTAPLALVLLIAGLGVGAIALVIGSLRIGQLRRRIRADRTAARPAH